MLNQLKTIGLLGILGAGVVGLGALVAPGHLYLFGALALALNLGAYFFSDKLVLRMHGARQLSPAEAPRLSRTVAELAERAEIPTPRLFIIDEAQPNAFATGRNPSRGVVAVTRGIVELLSERELRGVIAHELAHIKNRDILIGTIAAAMSALVSYVGQALTFGALFGGMDDDDDGGSLIVALLAPIGATLIQLGISRSREYAADETGAELSGDPEALASALIKLERGATRLPLQTQPATASLFIVNPLFDRGTLSRWFSTHPSTAQRVERLLAMAGRSRMPAIPLSRMRMTW